MSVSLFMFWSCFFVDEQLRSCGANQPSLFKHPAVDHLSQSLTNAYQSNRSMPPANGGSISNQNDYSYGLPTMCSDCDQRQYDIPCDRWFYSSNNNSNNNNYYNTIIIHNTVIIIVIITLLKLAVFFRDNLELKERHPFCYSDYQWLSRDLTQLPSAKLLTNNNNMIIIVWLLVV